MCARLGRSAFQLQRFKVELFYLEAFRLLRFDLTLRAPTFPRVIDPFLERFWRLSKCGMLSSALNFLSQSAFFGQELLFLSRIRRGPGFNPNVQKLFDCRAPGCSCPDKFFRGPFEGYALRGPGNSFPEGSIFLFTPLSSHE